MPRSDRVWEVLDRDRTGGRPGTRPVRSVVHRRPRSRRARRSAGRPGRGGRSPPASSTSTVRTSSPWSGPDARHPRTCTSGGSSRARRRGRSPAPRSRTTGSSPRAPFSSLQRNARHFARPRGGPPQVGRRKAPPPAGEAGTAYDDDGAFACVRAPRGRLLRSCALARQRQPETRHHDPRAAPGSSWS